MPALYLCKTPVQMMELRKGHLEADSRLIDGWSLDSFDQCHATEFKQLHAVFNLLFSGRFLKVISMINPCVFYALSVI